MWPALNEALPNNAGEQVVHRLRCHAGQAGEDGVRGVGLLLQRGKGSLLRQTEPDPTQFSIEGEPQVAPSAEIRL
jgi:hypothetical protein